MEKRGYKERHSNWNYGGPNWKLSRSKIDLFNECQRCFYLDNKIGVKRPSFPPFNLNIAVDLLLKKEFDNYRSLKKPHPIMQDNGVEAIPFSHSDLDSWRENFEGVQFKHEPTGLTISGAVDDLWVNEKQEIIVVDYKSTSKQEEITLDDEWKDAYKRQIDVYQWLLRQKGFEVSETAYFLYANALQDQKDFSGQLKFDLTLHKYIGHPEWVEPIIFKIKEVLEKDELPEFSPTCEYCGYKNLSKKYE